MASLRDTVKDYQKELRAVSYTHLDVYKRQVGSGANRTQDVDIYLNYIGRFVVPEVVVELTEEEKLAEAKRQEKLEKKRASNRKYMARKREEARKAWAEIEAEKAKAVGQ